MGKLKTKILAYKHDFVRFKNKSKENLKKSEDFKAFLGMLTQITLFSLLGGLSYLFFTTDSLLIKFIGIGCLLWLLDTKVIDMLTRVLGSIVLSRSYK